MGTMGRWAYQGFALTNEQTLAWARFRNIPLGDGTDVLGHIDNYFEENNLPGFCIDLPFAAPGHPDAAYLFVTRLRLVKTQADATFKKDKRQVWMWKFYFLEFARQAPEMKKVPMIAISDPARGLFAPHLTWMMYEDSDPFGLAKDAVATREPVADSEVVVSTRANVAV